MAEAINAVDSCGIVSFRCYNTQGQWHSVDLRNEQPKSPLIYDLHGVQVKKKTSYIKVIVHPKMIFFKLITHPHVIPTP